MADDAPFDNVCNSRASHCAFYSQQLFTTTFTPPPSDCFLGGIGNGLQVHGLGSAMITLWMHKSKLIHLYIPNHYMFLTSHAMYFPHSGLFNLYKNKIKIHHSMLPTRLSIFNRKPHCSFTLSSKNKSSSFPGNFAFNCFAYSRHPLSAYKITIQ